MYQQWLVRSEWTRGEVCLLELVEDESAAEEPTASPGPLLVLPLSPPPLEPTGDWGFAYAKVKKMKARRYLRSCMLKRCCRGNW